MIVRIINMGNPTTNKLMKHYNINYIFIKSKLFMLHNARLIIINIFFQGIAFFVLSSASNGIRRVLQRFIYKL